MPALMQPAHPLRTFCLICEHILFGIVILTIEYCFWLILGENKPNFVCYCILVCGKAESFAIV